MRKLILVKKEKFNELIVFLKFIEETYWSDQMTCKIARELRRDLKW